MSLKEYLRKIITKHIVESREMISQLEESLNILNSERLYKSDYTVNLYSLWEDEGLKSTTTEHNGTLKEAIEAAEAEFREVNKWDDIQAKYTVQIHIGKRTCSIPEKFWKKYTSRGHS